MSILTTDLRIKRNRFFYEPTTYRTIAHYYTHTTKSTAMKDSFREDFFFGNIRPFPDLLRKNLADTLLNQQTHTPEMATSKESKIVNNDYSKLSGITNFISGMFSVVASAMFRRQKSPMNCLDDDQVGHKENWQYSSTNNKTELCKSVDVCQLNLADMTDSKTLAGTYEDNRNKVRQFLPETTSQHQTMSWLRCPNNTFIESDLVEDCFEDALSVEECFHMPRNPYVEYFCPSQYQRQELFEVDAPKTKFEAKFSSKSKTLAKEPVRIALGCLEKYSDVQEISYTEVNNKLVESCQDKVSKLKAYLEQRNKNKAKASETDSNDLINAKPTKSITITNCKSRRFKNPNRLCSKRVKTNMKQIIENEMLFANEVNLDDFSSVEDSPSFHSLEKWSESPQSNNTTEDYFDEISGRFQATSAASSEDSFQIVFSNVPKRYRSTSECDSEDSFIVFEDSPDSCFTSNDVFCDSDDDDSDSDSDLTDSGCGNMKLSQSLSRTVSNLTDDSLYDEVDSVHCLPSGVVSHKGLSKSKLPSDYHKMKKDLPVKKVHFSSLPPKVHVMHVWAFAARQARAGHWEQFALDRERFRRRIADVDLALDWVLKPQHRTRILFQRFMPWWNAQKRRELAEQEEYKARRESEANDLHETIVIEEMIEETHENNEKENNEESFDQLQSKELQSDYTKKNGYTLSDDIKQREIITSDTRRLQEEEEEYIQRRRREGETKSQPNSNESLDTELNKKLSLNNDKEEYNMGVVGDVDKRILKSNSI